MKTIIVRVLGFILGVLLCGVQSIWWTKLIAGNITGTFLENVLWWIVVLALSFVAAEMTAYKWGRRKN